MILVDTSVWVEVLKDKDGGIVQDFRDWVDGRFMRLPALPSLNFFRVQKMNGNGGT